MEYLKDIEDKLTSESEENIIYTDIFKSNGFLYGAPFFNTTRSFRKFTFDVDSENEKILDDAAKNEYSHLMFNSSGCYLLFRTNSKKIIIKAELKRKWDILRATLYNSSGFDFYTVNNGVFIHNTIFAPKTGQNIFADSVNIVPGSCVCIFLPLYNEIKSLYVGTTDVPEKVELMKSPPIIFYGNSITQGAAASRSGNAFCNIVARKLKNNIYNLSVSSCCKGQLSVADELGTMNARVIVIDYTRNANDHHELEQNHLDFYKRIRMHHKDTPIILMTVSCFNKRTGYNPYDKVVYDTYDYAVKNGHNTYLLDQRKLFDESDWDLISLDGSHYTDLGMYKIADEIIKLIRKAEEK